MAVAPLDGRKPPDGMAGRTCPIDERAAPISTHPAKEFLPRLGLLTALAKCRNALVASMPIKHAGRFGEPCFHLAA
jgi:hypothetical protein